MRTKRIESSSSGARPPRARRSSVALLVLACLAAPSGSRAQSFLVAGVTSTIWGGPGFGCGNTSTGNTLAPAPAVTQNCSHEYTTTRGSSSTIRLAGAAQTDFGHISMESSGSWTDLGPPDFTHGNWGATAYSTESAAGQSHLDFSVRNDGDVPHTYSLSMTLSLSGNMYYSGDVDVDPVLFPWAGSARGILSLSLGGLGGGCDLSVASYQAYLAPRVDPNGYHFSSSCVGGTPTVTIPAHSYTPLVLFLEGAATAATNPDVVTVAGAGDYGLDVDFYHTIGLSDVHALVDGALVDPATLDITSDAPVRIATSGLVSSVPGTTAPEPTSALSLGGGIVALLVVRRRATSSSGRARAASSSRPGWTA